MEGGLMAAPARHASPWLVYGLILLGIVARLTPHPWNATPTMAIALFAGTHLSKRWALALPLLMVGATDVILLWHGTVPFTWGAFALTGLLAWWIRPRPTAGRIAAASVAGSVLFFLITNFGVWATQALYPRTPDGLWQCYVAALPFFRNTVLGDLFYAVALFGGYALLAHARPARASSL
jgi:hypothetical protein